MLKIASYIVGFCSFVENVLKICIGVSSLFVDNVLIGESRILFIYRVSWNFIISYNFLVFFLGNFFYFEMTIFYITFGTFRTFFFFKVIVGLIKPQRSMICWWIVFQSVVLIYELIRYPSYREANVKSGFEPVVKIFVPTYTSLGGLSIVVLGIYCWMSLPKVRNNSAPTRTESSYINQELSVIETPPPSYGDAIKIPPIYFT